MRNLKRALSLALASVMLLGMMVVGTSAASYPDVAAEDNVEAISVLNAVGAMIGDENGNFNPDTPVTRNQMAAVVARLLLGPDAEDYAGTVPFTDVPEWAVKYVAACYDNGIVTGRDETTYDGDGTVTAQEAGVMMLRALGYENITDTGADWAKRAVAKAGEISLFKGVTGNVTATLTRNDIAQLSLNTLKSTCVNADVDRDIVVEGVVTIPGKVTYTDRTTTEYDYTQSDGKYAGTEGTTGTLQLCEKLYGEDLTFADSGAEDSYGRPATAWSFDGDEVIKVAKAARKTYEGEVKTGTIYSDLGLSGNVLFANIDVYEDGVDVKGSYFPAENDDEGEGDEPGAPATGSIVKKGEDKYGKVGQTVEVYYTKAVPAATEGGEGTPASAKIIITNTYLAIVTDDEATEDDKDGVDITVYGPDAGAGEYFYETNLYQKDDILLVQVADESDSRNASDMKIQAILGAPETVTGSVTRVGKDKDLTVNGTKYPVAAQFSDADGDVIDGLEDTTDVDITSDATYTLYLDRNDNVLAVVEDENNATTSNVVYVANYAEAGTLKDGKLVYGMYATVVYMDGTYKEVLDGDTYNDSQAGEPGVTDDGDGGDEEAYTPAAGDFATLVYDETEDTYDLKELEDYTKVNMTATNEAKVELKASAKSNKFGTDTDYWLSGKTVYLFVNMKKNDAGEPTDKIDTVERFVGGVDFKTETAGVFAKDAKNNVSYVIFKEAYESSVSDVIYISNTAAQGKEENGWLYKGYKDGSNKEETYLVSHYNGSKLAGAETIEKGFYEYTMTDKDAMKLVAYTDCYTATVDSVSPDGMISVTAVPETPEEGEEGEKAQSDEAPAAIGPFDASGTKIVDLTEGKEDKGSAYNRAITTLAALKTAVEKTEPSYTVTVTFYANDDDEVQALFITSVAQGASAPSTGSDVEKTDASLSELKVNGNAATVASEGTTATYSISSIGKGEDIAITATPDGGTLTVTTSSDKVAAKMNGQDPVANTWTVGQSASTSDEIVFTVKVNGDATHNDFTITLTVTLSTVTG